MHIDEILKSPRDGTQSSIDESCPDFDNTAMAYIASKLAPNKTVINFNMAWCVPC